MARENPPYRMFFASGRSFPRVECETLCRVTIAGEGNFISFYLSKQQCNISPITAPILSHLSGHITIGAHELRSQSHTLSTTSLAIESCVSVLNHSTVRGTMGLCLSPPNHVTEVQRVLRSRDGVARQPTQHA